ncbi:ribosome-associated protein [Thalassospira sp. MBR-102]|uniref:Ribosomal silencing factor RsfS n=3 Tax=Thalassospira TaxID=168934 RepID=A0ABR5Y5J2_9PROT|nr:MULTISPECIES: ribosome silencing factor [Thalassospira]AJD50498.1 iojap-like protein [Thalassospira xiamenensis M-5 = DSM 17429]KEO55807.1 ribosome-associated protein IOJAP [Thalassospira permensis NBRC 106175]KZD04828.1 ribosome-associated protein IOJAP [Thalassospira xiamenensis]KZD05606.1 ribosome-associated protein IOJAP [Thalassospira xiamenensis]MAB34536.1 ribosome silencing factor [Thalassospira sp.]
MATIGTAKKTLTPGELLALIQSTLEDDKAEDLVTINLIDKTSLADHMIIATGSSSRRVASMAEHIVEKLKEAGQGRAQAEGKEQGDWVLVDAGDVIVHLFRPEVRAFYNIEQMWGVENPALKQQAARLY